MPSLAQLGWRILWSWLVSVRLPLVSSVEAGFLPKSLCISGSSGLCVPYVPHVYVLRVAMLS